METSPSHDIEEESANSYENITNNINQIELPQIGVHTYESLHDKNRTDHTYSVANVAESSARAENEVDDTGDAPNKATTTVVPVRWVIVIVLIAVAISSVISLITGIVVYNLAISNNENSGVGHVLSQTAESETNISDALANEIANVNSAVKQLNDTLLAHIRYNYSETLGDITTISTDVQKLDNIVHIIQGKQNYSGQMVSFTVHTPTNHLVNGCPTFKTILINIGRGYNTTTGIFHSPVSGLYLFSMTLYANRGRTGSVEIWCNIVKDSTLQTTVSTYQGQYDSASVCVFIYMTVGESIVLQCSNWDNIYGNPHTVYTGSLIKAD